MSTLSNLTGYATNHGSARRRPSRHGVQRWIGADLGSDHGGATNDVPYDGSGGDGYDTVVSSDDEHDTPLPTALLRDTMDGQ